MDFTYHGFKFRGFTCKDREGSNNGGGREVEGECGPDRGDDSPSFEYGEGFSIDEMEVHTEFDTDLEFVYEMPDGKECRQRSRCEKGGSTVKNTQCGGAKKVVVVHPRQPERKERCKFRIPKIRFDCETAPPPKATSPVETPESTEAETETVDIPVTTDLPEVSTTAVSEPGTTEESEEPETTVNSESPEESTPAEESTGEPEESTEAGVPSATTEVEEPESTVTSSSPEETVESEIPSSTQVETQATEESPEESTPAPSEPVVETTVTSHMTTSTIFTTSVSTITSCAPEVTDCPEGEEGTEVVTVTVPISTTICPVTETITRTREETTAEESSPAEEGSTTEDSSPEPPTSEDSPDTPATTSAPGTTAPASPSASVPAPQETLPCPEVVPSCLNTWIFDTTCADNTDTSCFCPSAAFVENVFTCIYAHAPDDVVAEAITYFQGLCAGHVPENPGIVTGVDSITSIITVTEAPKQTAGDAYTTVVVTRTTTVPCVEDGTTISGSSTVEVVEQTAEVPRVGFHTDTEGVVGVVPSTAAPVVVPSTVPSTLIVQPSATATEEETYPEGTEDASPEVPEDASPEGPEDASPEGPEEASPEVSEPPVVAGAAGKAASMVGVAAVLLGAVVVF